MAAAGRALLRLGVFGVAFAVAWVLANALVYPLLVTVIGVVTRSPVVPPMFSWMFLLAAWAATVVALRHMEDAPWERVGLHGASWHGQRLATGAIVGWGGIVALLGLLLATGGARVEATDGAAVPWGAVLAAAGRALWVLAPAALWEEMVFRGYLWHVAEEAAGARTALAASSIGFGLVHLLNPGVTLRSVLLVIAAGVCLGLIREATASVPAAWLAHLAWNWVMAAVAHAPVSGMPFDAPGWRLVPAGPAWWGGGSWGPEGGAASLLVLVVGAVWWLRTQSRRHAPAACAAVRD